MKDVWGDSPQLMKTHCFAEVEIVERRSCVRLFFKEVGQKALCAGVLTLPHELWASMEKWLAVETELETELITPTLEGDDVSL